MMNFSIYSLLSLIVCSVYSTNNFTQCLAIRPYKRANFTFFGRLQATNVWNKIIDYQNSLCKLSVDQVIIVFFVFLHNKSNGVDVFSLKYLSFCGNDFGGSLWIYNPAFHGHIDMTQTKKVFQLMLTWPTVKNNNEIVQVKVKSTTWGTYSRHGFFRMCCEGVVRLSTSVLIGCAEPLLDSVFLTTSLLKSSITQILNSEQHHSWERSWVKVKAEEEVDTKNRIRGGVKKPQTVNVSNNCDWMVFRFAEWRQKG